MTTRTKIAIFTTQDYLWAFPTWAKTITLLQADYEVVGIYLFPEKLGKMQGWEARLWYWRVFGLLNFVILGLYGVKSRLVQLLGAGPQTWSQLAQQQNLILKYGTTPNAPEVRQWVAEPEIDVIFIMVSHILKAPIIESARVGIINKHAALLPSCRGVFPYFWARLHGFPAGVTFHQVDIGIDTGQTLVQSAYSDATSSLLRFYIEIYDHYPTQALQAIQNLLAWPH